MQVTEEEIILRNQMSGNEAFMGLIRRLDEISAADLFNRVSEFNSKFGIPVTASPDFQLPYALQRLKIVHMKEELDEYQEAVETGDMVKAFDALIDLVYVALGAAYSHRFPFNQGFARVHDKNMLKERALKASDSKRGSKFDVVKPAGWTPPVLDDLIPGAS